MLVIDIGGTHVKVLADGQQEPLRLPSGPEMTPTRLVAAVKEATREWKYDAISIGYPGPVSKNTISVEPYNLGRGWVGFDFQAAFGHPVKLINDAAMQALGGYRGGKMLFLGFGTGLGSTFIVQGIVEPMELGHLPYKKATFEDYVGARGLEKYGKSKWRRNVEDVVARLIAALLPEDVVLGGGNVKKLKSMPAQCRAGNNADAFVGGFRLWEKEKVNGTTRKNNRGRTGDSAPSMEGAASSLQEGEAPAPAKAVRARRGPRRAPRG